MNPNDTPSHTPAGQAAPMDLTFLDDAALMAEAQCVIDQEMDFFILPLQTGGFTGFALQLPNVLANGPTRESCIAALRELLLVEVGHRLSRDLPVPGHNRTEDATINLRLPAEQKVILQRLAQARGVGLSELLRDALQRTIAEQLPALAGR